MALAFAAVFAAVAVWKLPAAFGTVLMFLAAIVYERAIVWVDKNGTWS